jgi:LPXTG-site transpeptidase (sortase) family protein
MSDLDKDNNVYHPKKLKEGEEVSLGIPAPQPEPKAEIIKRPSHTHHHKKVESTTKGEDHSHKPRRSGDIRIAPHAQGDLTLHRTATKNGIGAPERPKSHPQINLMPEHHRKNIKHETTARRGKAAAKLAAIRSHKHWHNAKLVIGTVLVFVLVFNSQWFISQIMYFFNRPKSQPVVQTEPAKTSQKDEQPQAEIVGPENVIIIPKINVTAPLVFPTTTNEADVLVALRDGVVHYYGTAMPGENGNAAFFGHSSNDWWEPGNYKFIFVILERLAVGDTYEIHYNSRKYIYQVTETKVVAPNDLSVLNQTAEPTSTLITCTPPGTSWRRFVVSAKQISPAPKAALKPDTKQVQPATTNLPSASPSIWEQIKTFFEGLFGKKQESVSTTQTQPTEQTNHLPEVN